MTEVNNNKEYLVPIKIAVFAIVMYSLAVLTEGVLWF